MNSHIKNLRSCLTMISKHSKAIKSSRGDSHAFSCFDIIVKHSRAFLMYNMNDLPNAVKSADICMYADDTSMSSTIKNTRDLETKIIPEFFNMCDWLKALNALKTEFMIMGTTRELEQLVVQY